MEDTRPVCNWRLNADGLTSDVGEPPGGCRLPPGFRGWVFQTDPPGSWREDSPRAKVRPRKVAKTVQKEHPVEEVAQPAGEPVPAAPVTVASVGVPAVPSASDLSKVAADAGGGATGVLMALIAVVGGGGAVWKYLQSKQRAAAKRDELAHEQRMKELELQADNQKRDDDRHGECKTARDALAARIDCLEQQGRLAEQTLSALRDRIDAVAAKAETPGENPAMNEYVTALSKRITKVETLVKTKKGVR